MDDHKRLGEGEREGEGRGGGRGVVGRGEGTAGEGLREYGVRGGWAELCRSRGRVSRGENPKAPRT